MYKSCHISMRCLLSHNNSRPDFFLCVSVCVRVNLCWPLTIDTLLVCDRQLIDIWHDIFKRLVNSVHNNPRPDYWEFLSNVGRNSQQSARSLNVLFVHMRKRALHSLGLFCEYEGLFCAYVRREVLKSRLAPYMCSAYSQQSPTYAQKRPSFAKEPKKMTTPLTFETCENIIFAWRLRTSHLSAVEYKEPTVDGKLTKEPYTFAKEPYTFAKEH